MPDVDTSGPGSARRSGGFPAVFTHASALEGLNLGLNNVDIRVDTQLLSMQYIRAVVLDMSLLLYVSNLCD